MKSSSRHKATGHPVALVTGAGKRLGRQIALALAAQGFDIVVHYNHSKRGAGEVLKKIHSMGRNALVVQADVRNSEEIRALVDKAYKKFGRIDVLVNSAAVFLPGSLLETSGELWDTTIDINLKGPFLCSQAVAPYMLKQKHGKIINISSLGGLQAWKGHLPYSVSKAGLIMLTKILAKELAPSISVNTIAPGTIILKGEEDPRVRHVPEKSILMKKYGEPSNITDLVVFLATKAEYITGQVFAVDGGRSIQ